MIRANVLPSLEGISSLRFRALSVGVMPRPTSGVQPLNTRLTCCMSPKAYLNLDFVGELEEGLAAFPNCLFQDAMH